MCARVSRVCPGSPVSFTGGVSDEGGDDFLSVCPEMKGVFLAMMVGFTSADATCTDTCKYAFDHVCDDGGPGSSWSFCSLGTDCSDCGQVRPPSALNLPPPPPRPPPPPSRPPPPTLVCPAIIATAQTQHLMFSIPSIILVLVPFLSMALCPNPLNERGCGGRGQHGVLALILAVILPVCYGLILATFPFCDGHGYSPDPFCTACLGWWYAPIGTIGSYGGLISPILLVFNGITLGGMVASVYIACLCLCGSKPVPRAVWAIWVWLFMTLFLLFGVWAFLVFALVVICACMCGHFQARRAPAQDSSNETSIGSLSETATSSLMSNQATPEVHVVPNTLVHVPVGVPVVLTPMASNSAPNVPMAVHVPMAPALVKTFPMAVHVPIMAQHDHMAPTIPVVSNGPEVLSCTVAPLQCPPEGQPAPKASSVDAWGLD